MTNFSIMKFIIALFLLVSSSFVTIAQNSESCFQEDEFLEFKINYLSFNTSTATLNIKKETLNEKSVYHIIGEGKSSRFLSLFFKIRDRYETYIDMETYLPYKFIRDINEGGYTKDIIIDFDQTNNKATVNNRKHKTIEVFDTEAAVHDMISSFYYLRNNIDVSTLKEGHETKLTMFFDNKNYPFKLKFLGREVIRTSFGKKSCLLFRPIVMADRVFKEEESLTVWISDDENKIPVKISAELAVGSLTANLSEHKGLKHPFTTN